MNERHVAAVTRSIADPGPGVFPDRKPATDADYDEAVEGWLASAPAGGFWVFAYGSLIWNPVFESVEQRLGTAFGWRRAFCLGWDYRFRGSVEKPGLMMALDRGGRCRGVVYRMAEESKRASLDRLVRREMSMVPSAFPPRWIKVATEDGPLTALTFAIDRNSGRYVSGLTDEELADVLSCACGFRGSMAEYLLSTVTHLEALGIRDRHLWRMQELVAERIEKAHGL